jgi:hypothetical protein
LSRTAADSEIRQRIGSDWLYLVGQRLKYADLWFIYPTAVEKYCLLPAACGRRQQAVHSFLPKAETFTFLKGTASTIALKKGQNPQ